MLEKYITEIASKYNLNIDDLKSIWKTLNTSSSVDVDETNKPNEINYMSMTKPELIKLCKEKKVKCSGTKTELINYLTSNIQTNTKTMQSTLKKTTPTIPTNNNVPSVLKSLCSQKNTIKIHRNQFGNFEHEETGFIFNNKTQKVIGKQNKNGDIDTLDSNDIDTCNKYKFSYLIPNNLDSKQAMSDVNIDDIEDDLTVNDTIDNDIEDEDGINADADMVEEEYEEVYEDEYED